MKAQLVSKSFNMTGIKNVCLFNNFHQALLEAKTEFDKKVTSHIDDRILIIYEMTKEELHEDRKELFYYGKMIEDSVPLDGMELIQIVNQSFVMATHKGIVSEIWKGYNAINEYLKGNLLEEDKASYAVELYDSRFNPELNESEMEIYMPVKKKN